MDTPLPSFCTSVRPPGVRAVFYRYWILPEGRHDLEFISEGVEWMLEMAASEFIAALQEHRLPLVSVDTPAFYQSLQVSIATFTPWNHIFGLITPRTQSWKWIQAQGFPLVHEDGRRYFDGVLLDITPKVETRSAYQTLTSHIANTPLAVIEWDDHWRVTRWTGHAEAMFGWTEAEVLGKHPDQWRFVHEDDEAHARGILERLTRDRLTNNVETNRNYTKDGRIRHCEWRNSILLNEVGEFHCCLSLVLDITDRVQITEKLARSEWRLRTALGAAGMLGWEGELSGENFHTSDDYARFFGIEGVLTKENLNQVIHPDDRALLLAEFSQAAKNHTEVNTTFRGANPAADGGTRWFVTRSKLVDDDEYPARFVGVTADITDRKRAEEQRTAMQKGLLESQKYESLGLLASGVAHDFNNLLTVILGNASLARMSLKASDPANERLAQVEAACQRATTVCRQMLAYAGKTRVAPRSLDLSALVTNSVELIRSAAGRQSKLTFQTPSELPPVRGETQALQQVLLSLITNAIESYGETTGAITVSTGTETIREHDDHLTPPIDAGTYVYLEVRDQGSGMADDVKSRMFDPFFSTKFTGRGLGLAAGMGIVRAHRGSVRVTTEPQAGTAIRVLLPVLDTTITSSKSPG